MTMDYSMKDYMMMTPGPTQIHPTVLSALAYNYTNPDLDPDFFSFHQNLCQKITELMHSDGRTLILGGEGILGLEAACASFIEQGDRVLTISNGIFGRGFDDFSKMYGAETSIYEGDLRSGLDAEAIHQFIQQHGPFELATLVHCETPSGITNDIAAVGEVLKRHDIFSIVDAVSSFGGEPLDMMACGFDAVLCGSQKVISAPVGLSTVTISPRAIERLKNRSTPIRAYYANLAIWLDVYEKKSFPYTQPIQLIKALDTAIDRICLNNREQKHLWVGNAVRQAFVSLGFELYALDHFSNTVTTVLLPEGIEFDVLFTHMKDMQGILIGGGFNYLENRIFRIGHMGENASFESMRRVFEALGESFRALGRASEDDFAAVFNACALNQ
ncbi:MAG: alanine--glyoxylate aminotransferase family protein [Erysipelotrichaceae bacterium]|nr:alanine--glyoxylate aminotransferase family protein [Erysipelotrichaceae bacterium]